MRIPIAPQRTLALAVTLLAVVTSVAAADPPADRTGKALLAAARAAAAEGNSELAIRRASEALVADPSLSAGHYLLGRETFRLGRIDDSIEHFDRYVQLQPAAEPQQWERGIALFYGGQYRRGAAQFTLYQTYSATDVENSVWRFLCMAADNGVTAARAAMLPVRDDPRVPMAEILQMYQGKLEPDAVLAAAQRGRGNAEREDAQRFYAHLYVALYYDVTGRAEQAAKFIALAADEKNRTNRFVNRFMWDVARIHAARRGAANAERFP